jgi:hypothetical protein
MSFMAVAYVLAFLEDRANFVKERANGLYGATPFMVSNFIIGLPFLCKFSWPLMPKGVANWHRSSDLAFVLYCLILAIQLHTHC